MLNIPVPLRLAWPDSTWPDSTLSTGPKCKQL
jgi:hypothetical protein